MSAHPSLDDISDALKQSGYLMEQEVATQLEDLDFHVQTNWAFKDSDEGKSREIDVRAIKRVAHNTEERISAFVEILIECKNNANPFVLIVRRKNKADIWNSPREIVFPIGEYEMQKKLDGNRSQVRKINAFFHLGFDKIHYGHLRSHKAVQFCRMERYKSSWKANHGGLYDSVFFPIAKAINARRAEVLPQAREHWRHFWIIVPMVVVSGDMYSVDPSQRPLEPQRADFVSFNRDVRSGTLNGRFTIEFVSQDAIQKFVTVCVEPLIKRVSELTMNEADFVLNRNIPWVDQLND